jgi:formylglycine-generating enzyme required for sulfatase activity
MSLPFDLVLVLGAVAQAGEAPAAFRPLGVNARGARIFERLRDGARVVWIPAGTFRQNGYFPRETDEPESEWVEVPGFAIDETEVTNRQFARFLNESGRATDDEGRALVVPVESGLEMVDGAWRVELGFDDLPALGVTGWGALAYARSVGGDLPRLAEWQKAASGVDGLTFPWGFEPAEASRANYRRFGPDAPTAVGSYPEGMSPFGLLDAAGNVYERVYGGGRGRGGLPTMIRGGSWASPHPLNLRTFDLCMQPMEVADRTVGFRCVVREGEGLPAADATSSGGAAEDGEALRMARSWRDAVTEARERNVPLLLSLQYDTCGQCDRIKVGLFRDPAFVSYCNENAVLAVGHIYWDGSDDPHPEGDDGRCPLYPQLSCHEHIDLFYEGLKRVEGFRISPGNFILDPRASDEAVEGEGGEGSGEVDRPAARWVLIEEGELPKWGGGAQTYVEKLREAQSVLGAAIPRAEWLRRQEGGGSRE